MLNTLFVTAMILGAAPTAPVHPVLPKTTAPQPTAPVIKMQTKLTDEKQGGDSSLPTSVLAPTLSKNYNHPGVVARQGADDGDPTTGEWIGGDHLINLPSNIPVQLDLSLPESKDTRVEERKLEQVVEEVFKKYNINPEDYTDSSVPPLPYFNIIVTVYQVPKGYVYVIQARLFESVKLERVAFDEGVALQAITWEMSSLNGVPEDKLLLELNQSIAGIATTFAQRYNYFKKIEQSQGKK